MKSKVTIVRNQFLSEQEEKLAKFCKENGINFNKKVDYSGRGKNNYDFEFKPKFIDETEAKVVSYLDCNNINYKFAIDSDGMHHYQFDSLIEIDSAKPNVIIDRKFVEKYSMPKLKRDYSKIEFIEEDQQIELHENEIKKLESKVEELYQNKHLNWKQKTWSFLWFPYKKKLKEETKAAIATLKNEIEDKRNSIKRIESEKKNMEEMLILADVPPEEPKIDKEKVKKTKSILKESLEELKVLDYQCYQKAMQTIKHLERIDENIFDKEE